MAVWSTNTTKIENEVIFVNNTYKDANGNNKLSTITASNPGGYTFINRNSSDPIVRELAFAVQNDGKITYIISGSNRQYNSIQDIADARLSGYTAQTTLQIKDALQRNLTASVQRYNQANPTSPIGPPTATPPAAPLPQSGVADIDAVPLENPTITPDFQNLDFTGGSKDNLRYPLDLQTSSQDCIQFSMETNEGRSLSGGGDGIFKGLGARNPTTSIEGTVTLPIQSGITDSNGVEWGGQNLDAKDAYLASLALGGITSDQGLGGNVGGLLGRVFKDIKDAAAGDTSEGQNFKKAINLYLAQEAVGIQGLLSRASGAILNPNLELLFNGPTLRSFSFTFRLSPRSAKEAENVRRIIRFFKEGMSVKTASNEVFLKSPNLFNIKYIAAGTDKEHKSLPQIKKCALLGCDVDYTPDGTYMTFNDEAKTMTSFQLSLRFSEIEPIYSNNYQGIPLDQIGY